MIRLPAVALIWLLALMASAAPPTSLSVARRTQAGIHQTDAAAVPSLFKPARVGHLQSAAPVRPSLSRYTFPHADLTWQQGIGLVQAGRTERSSQLLILPGPIAGLGTPRFPTGPPRA